jgi:cysteinyl-tRNA synthetase
VLRIHDTAIGSVVPVEPRQAGKVSMYVCGPTVYGVPHVGHGKTSLVFDVLRRYLEWAGFEVDHVSNVTDIDDKIIQRSAEEGRTAAEIAEDQEAAWWAAMDALGIRRPTSAPHATAYVERMIELVAELERRGVAYETTDGVYLDVGKVPGYGLLALQPLDSLRAGARVGPAEDKRSALDFALWKKAKPGEPWWGSPWGRGRPGWHTECVVMSLDLLGEGFDIHGGGLDLAFPHHENERAQAVAAGRELARHWVHSGLVEVEGEKMSKSLGNFTSLPDLLARTDPRAYRLLVLRSHYRKPLEVTPATIADAEEALGRLDALARRFGAVAAGDDGRDGGPGPPGEPDQDAVARFRERMEDDLDTPGALAVVFEVARAANTADDAGDTARGRRLAETAAWLASAVGIRLSTGEERLDPEVAELVRRRDEARSRRDFAAADEIRDRLRSAGWTVEDTPRGTKVWR